MVRGTDAEALAREFSGPVCIQGISTGGSIAQQFAIDHPQLVRRLADDVFDASPELHRISAPTLLIAGERDRFYSPELFRETAERIPDARLCLCPGKGHAGALTHKPTIRELLEFLTADQPSSPLDVAPPVA